MRGKLINQVTLPEERPLIVWRLLKPFIIRFQANFWSGAGKYSLPEILPTSLPRSFLKGGRKEPWEQGLLFISAEGGGGAFCCACFINFSLIRETAGIRLRRFPAQGSRKKRGRRTRRKTAIDRVFEATFLFIFPL